MTLLLVFKPGDKGSAIMKFPAVNVRVGTNKSLVKARNGLGRELNNWLEAWHVDICD